MLASISDAKELVAKLNDGRAAVTFASGSADVSDASTAFLKRAAADIKHLSAGYVLEVAGYTDNTGNPAANVALSQMRTDSVRNLLIKAGASASMLVAKGYGSADPTASNDTPEGRLRNRRIEYHIIKTP